MPVEITETPVIVTVGSANLVGREVIVTPHMPWSGDVTAEADAYRTRNAGKTRIGHIWRGVRYAEPPVGARRFKPALDYDYPAGTYDLSEWGNVPIQTGGQENGDQGRPPNPTVGSQNWRGIGTQESEDCLTMNLYRPQGTPPDGGWPMLAWVHGGGWTQNSALQQQWRAEHLATKGIMVASIEYRLSIFGHAYHPDWELEPDWQGPSFAPTDIKSALRWINRNIAAFGGNPANVTLAGSSAGGECTLSLMEDASTAGLFQRAWAVSGGGLAPRDPKGPTENFWGYGALYERLWKSIEAVAPLTRDYGNPSRTLADAIAADGLASALRTAVSPSLLLALLNRRPKLIRGQFSDGTWVSARGSDANYYPWAGGGLVHESAVEAAKAGAYARPLIVSCAAHEASLLSEPDDTDAGISQTNNYIRRLNVFDRDEWLRQTYTDAGWDTTESRDISYNQAVFHYPAWRIARAMAQTASANRWLCMWNFTASGAANSTAGHSSDVAMMFGNPHWGAGGRGTDADPITGAAADPNRLTCRAIDMSNRMMQMLANFVGNGDPGSLYSRGTDFNLFASPGYFSPVQYSTGTPEHWNVIGKNALDAGSAPVECRHEAYFAGAWLDYLDRLE